MPTILVILGKDARMLQDTQTEVERLGPYRRAEGPPVRCEQVGLSLGHWEEW
jgi:hypothetical protein